MATADRRQSVNVKGLKIDCKWGDASTVREMLKVAINGFIEAESMKKILPYTTTAHRKLSLVQALETIGAKLVK